MRGSIRIFLGLLIAFGAVGTLDYNPDASLLVQSALAFTGLAISFWGILAREKEQA